MADRPLIILRASIDLRREVLLDLQAELQASAGAGIQILVIPARLDVISPLSEPCSPCVSLVPLEGEFGATWTDALERRLGLKPPKPKFKWWWPFRPRATQDKEPTHG